MADVNLARAAEAALDRLGDHESLWFEGRWLRAGDLHVRAARLAGAKVAERAPA